MREPQSSSVFRRAEISIGISVCIFALGAVIENVLHAFNVHGLWEWVDNFVCALLTALVVFAYENRRQKAVMERLRVIAAMNHHIRNALQPIVYATHETVPHEEQVKLIRNAVDRIRWALAEVLPGESENTPPLPGNVP